LKGVDSEHTAHVENNGFNEPASYLALL